MTSVLKFLGGLALAYGVVLALVFFFQARLVYFPMKGAYPGTPKVMGLAYERVNLPTEDGETLAAWWIPAPANANKGAVLLFHGNAGNIAHRLDYARMFFDLGYATLLVDYRGYGESSGTPSEAGTYRDAAASWAWLTQTRGVKPHDIVLFGESLGGGVATWLGAQHTQTPQMSPRALVLSSAFTSVPDLGAEVYPWLPVRWMSRIHYDNRANLARVRVPVLIAHSPQDEIIPYAHGQRLFAVASEPKAFVEMSGGHNEGFLFVRPAWIEALRAFLARYERKL